MYCYLIPRIVNSLTLILTNVNYYLLILLTSVAKELTAVNSGVRVAVIEFPIATTILSLKLPPLLLLLQCLLHSTKSGVLLALTNAIGLISKSGKYGGIYAPIY
jgi:hypothetical protein